MASTKCCRKYLNTERKTAVSSINKWEIKLNKTGLKLNLNILEEGWRSLMVNE